MHHKFPVVDFDKPTARVYLGSYNLSVPADTKNGENLLLAHPGDAAARPPAGGQYSHLVLREGGFSDDEISRLQSAGAVF